MIGCVVLITGCVAQAVSGPDSRTDPLRVVLTERLCVSRHGPGHGDRKQQPVSRARLRGIVGVSDVVCRGHTGRAAGVVTNRRESIQVVIDGIAELQVRPQPCFRKEYEYDDSSNKRRLLQKT